MARNFLFGSFLAAILGAAFITVALMGPVSGDLATRIITAFGLFWFVVATWCIVMAVVVMRPHSS